MALHTDIAAYNGSQSEDDRAICDVLAREVDAIQWDDKNIVKRKGVRHLTPRER